MNLQPTWYFDGPLAISVPSELIRQLTDDDTSADREPSAEPSSTKMTSGVVSFRSLRPYSQDNDDPNAIWARLPASTDMRLYDSMPYLDDFKGMVALDNMPESGTHLSCNAVGGLIAMYKGGGMLRDQLKSRWPAVFSNEGEVYKVRRPMGDPFLC